MLFHRYLFADYSGAEDVSSQRKSIAVWSQLAGDQPFKVQGAFTRSGLTDYLLHSLREATAAGERLLFGIDHQWSWPIDLWEVAGLRTVDWRTAVRELASGDPGSGRPPLGPPRIFPAAFNQWAGREIFHCRVRRQARCYSLPTAPDWNGNPIRLTERLVPGTKPATRLGGVGAVAGQTLYGLLELDRLLRAADSEQLPLVLWPFDRPTDPGSGHVGVEVYPGLFNAGPKSDDEDARACCSWAEAQDRAGRLGGHLNLGWMPQEDLALARMEGWVLGANTHLGRMP